MSRTGSTRPQEALWDLLGGAPILHALAVAARLAIPDLLAEGPRTATALARETGSHEDSLYRLLRALASAGVFTERPKRRFALTPISQLLRTGVPGSMRAIAVLAGEEWGRAWYDLPHAVRTGRSAFDHVYGESFYDWLAKNRRAARRFDDAMQYKWEALGDEVVDAYDFSRASRIVDVGGGTGTLIAAILARAPDASGVLFEIQAVASDARRRLHELGLDKRCRVVAGDLLDSVPGDGDLYVLAFVLHNWDDRRAVKILRNCRRVVAAGGRVLVIESILPPGASASPAKVHDLEMLVFMPGGRERTLVEYRALLEAAGLRLSRVSATRTPVSLLVASGI